MPPTRLPETTSAVPTRNPPWTRDELILALDLYMSHRPMIPGPAHADVVQLSTLLNRFASATGVSGSTKFRNTNGVAMKLQNFRRFDPGQSGKGLVAGARQEEEIWSTYAGDTHKLRTTAAAIREGVTAGREEIASDGLDNDEEATEGRVLTRMHRFRERDKAIISRRKERARAGGGLKCEACSFDFERRYGARGANFIECHHTKPVSELRPGERTKLSDLALLCANCHRIVHLRRPWLTVDELKQIMVDPGA